MLLLIKNLSGFTGSVHSLSYQDNSIGFVQQEFDKKLGMWMLDTTVGLMIIYRQKYITTVQAGMSIAKRYMNDEYGTMKKITTKTIRVYMDHDLQLVLCNPIIPVECDLIIHIFL